MCNNLLWIEEEGKMEESPKYNIDFEYDESTGKLSVIGLPFKAKLLEPTSEEHFKKIRSYTLHQRDLNRVKFYLDMFDDVKNENNELRKTFFNEAINAYMRCFLGGKRYFLDKAIYKSDENRKKHDIMEMIRHKIIAHDVFEFSVTAVEVIYNEEDKKIEAIGCIPGRIEFEYSENAEQLRELTEIAQSYVSKAIHAEQERLVEYFMHKTNDEICQWEECYIKFDDPEQDAKV